MNNLEEYIKRNLEAFDDKELPEGHDARFERRLETLGSVQGDRVAAREDRVTVQGDRVAVRGDRSSAPVKMVGGEKTEPRVRPLFRTVALALAGIAAAIAAVVIFIKSPKDNHEDWFAGVGEDQWEICQTYYGKMAEFYEAILADDIDDARLPALESIVAESVPMVDQLPEELDPETRAAILKEYYGALLDGMERLNNSVFN